MATNAPSGIPSRIKPPQPGFKRPAVSNENQQSYELKKQCASTMKKPASYSTSNLKRSYSVHSLNSAVSSFPTNKTMKKGILQPSINQGNTTAPKVSAPVSKRSKRPAWDLKGRIQDMENEFEVTQKYNKELHNQLQAYNERIISLENANCLLHQDVKTKDSQTQEASAVIEHLEKALRDKEEEYHIVIQQLKTEIENVKLNKEKLERQISCLKMELLSSQEESNSLKATISHLTASQAGLQTQYEAIKMLLMQEQEEGRKKANLIEKLISENKEQSLKIESLDCKIRSNEMERRHLHNIVQELKGNIRVFCRVRPLLPEESKDCCDINHINCLDPDHRNIQLTRLGDASLNESTVNGKIRGPGKYEFTFDKVFDCYSTQCDVFDEISQLVQSALDGYHVCIFAYGQTGSGKTYTMEGPEFIIDFGSESENPNLGIIPRAVLQIFSNAHDLISKGWKYQMEASFIEIYNETIRDLLGDSNNSNVKCEIKMTGSKGKEVDVTNVTTVPVTSQKQVYDLLKIARKNRAVAATQCNEHSSRSHSVFRLKLTGLNKISGEACEGTLNLVDLAGSERLKESCSEGVRLTETKNINRSLSNLGNVIMALAQKADHIPYRNSKLTYLLMNSLGGNSKTLMFVNVSPREDHFSETLNSLRFATKVNQCHIGTAHKRVH